MQKIHQLLFWCTIWWICLAACTASVSDGGNILQTQQAIEINQSLTRFTIKPEKSEARFYIDEVLLGQPKTVVGMTNQIEGEIFINEKTPAQSTVSQLRINAREFHTDSSFRDRAIQRQILETGKEENAWITFSPVKIIGLVNVDAPLAKPITFTITGDLTIHAITQSVPFTVTASLEDSQLLGTGKAVITRNMFGLTIPTVRNVTDVSEKVFLEFDFFALPTGD